MNAKNKLIVANCMFHDLHHNSQSYRILSVISVNDLILTVNEISEKDLRSVYKSGNSIFNNWLVYKC